MGQIVELEIPARADFLDVARMVVTTAASIEPTFPDERISDLRLVVSEACTNAIEASRSSMSGRSDERITLRCDLAEDRVEVEVEDQGGGFDLDDLSEMPSVTDPARLDHERGLGITLMREVADETEFRASEGGTAVRLVVYSTKPR
jgi:anti-sigma regulatory factor (Ser/Thr protein kinase)